MIPPKVEYELTELGRSLEPVLIALGRRATRNTDVIAANRDGRRAAG